jgi:hypothetical protein
MALPPASEVRLSRNPTLKCLPAVLAKKVGQRRQKDNVAPRATCF